MPYIGKILFLGNSITLHSPKPEIGWMGNWGMAASCEQRDYVHLVMDRARGIDPGAASMVLNIADFERAFWDYDMNLLAAAREFGADAVVMRIGENVENAMAVQRRFAERYSALIRYVNPGGNAFVICTNCFWDEPDTSSQIAAAAASCGWAFADISHVREDPRAMATDRFWHGGVGSHPSDVGMERIADIIWEAMKNHWERQG